MKNKKIIESLFWQIWDKILLVILEFFVGVKIANSFGSRVYGIYSYCLSLVVISRIGYELINKRVIIKEYLNKQDDNIIEVATFIKVVIGILILLFLLLFFNDNEIKKMVLTLAFIEVIRIYSFKYEVYSEVELNVKPYVIINNISKIFIYITQFIFIRLYKGVDTILIILLIGELLRIILLIRFFPKYQKFKIFKNISLKKIEILFKESIYFFIGSVYFLIFTQTDKIMLGYYISKESVGVYNIAVQLTNVLGIILIPVQNILYPVLIKINKQNEEKYLEIWRKYNIILTYLYLVLVLLSIVIVRYTFKYVYSESYIEAIKIYNILAIMVFFKANSLLRIIHINIYNLGKLLLNLSILGIVLNIFLNIFFLKSLGVIGIAIASTLTQLIVGNIMYVFFKEGRIIFQIQIQSFNILNLWRKK